MTLDEIWKQRTNICLVAARPGTTKYVALGHRTASEAFADAAPSQGLTLEDFKAEDWFVAEIVPDEQGNVARFVGR